MRDKCPRGLVEIFELGATQFGAVEELAWLVNVDAGDLEHAVLDCEFMDSLELFRSVTRRHIGNSAQALFFESFEELVKEFIFELFSLLVAGRRSGNITEIGVGGNGADGICELNNFLRSRQLVSGLNVDATQVFRLQDTQKIVDEVRILSVTECAFEGWRNVDTHALQAIDEALTATESLNESRCHRGKQVALCDTATVGILRDADHVSLRIERLQAKTNEDLVRGLSHLQGALETSSALGRQPLGNLFASRSRNTLNRHVGDAFGVRIVQLTSSKRTVGIKESADFKAGD